jgi:hypothetical protein
MLLCGCARNLADGAPAPLAVDLRALDPCRGFLKKVALPDLRTGPAGDYADVAVQKEDAAIMTANARIGAADNCVAGVQNRYGGKKP